MRNDLRDITPLEIKQSEMATKIMVDKRMVEPEKAHKLETFGKILYMARDLAAGASVCLGYSKCCSFAISNAISFFISSRRIPIDELSTVCQVKVTLN